MPLTFRALRSSVEMRGRIARLAAIVLPVFFSSCIHINRPAIPESLDPGKQAQYKTSDFKTAYEAYQKLVQAGDYDKAKIARDGMINRIEVDVEANYREYEGKLSSSRATADVLSDATQLGLSAATTVVGDSDVKDLLAASLTAFKGTKLSFDKNFFREKTTEILISKMEASRDKVRNRITQKLELPVQKYAFEEAWRDLVEFFYAGTLQAAFVQLANDAGSDAAAARKQAEDIDIRRASTQAEADLSVRIRSNFAKLYNQAIKGPDPQARESALKTAKDALVMLGEGAKITDKSTADDVFALLRAQITGALDHPENLPRIDKALTPPKEQ